MADLCRFEREAAGRGTGERAALFVVDRDIDDLEPLFTAVQSRLPRSSIWVIQGDIVIPVRIADADPAADPERSMRRPAPPANVGSGALPKLRFVEGASPVEGAIEPPAEDAEPSGEAVTPAELDMLLGFFDEGREPRPSPDRGGSR